MERRPTLRKQNVIHLSDELTVLLQDLRAHVKRSGCGECERRCNEMIDKIGNGALSDAT